ncbi:MAG: dicarboxylate/amino acid:cation symporter [Gemmataceae bacterium]|nr:dicarboxylate/amino acid:cation symporter [Gemmataceae bacterium]
MSEATNGRSMSLHTKILLGLVFGAACGVTANALTPGPALEPHRLHALTVNPTGGFPAAVPWAGVAEAVRPPAPRFVDWLITYIMEPVGQVFLRLLFLTVIPLVFSSLAVGVARLGDLRSLGRIGAKTFTYFVLTMSCAVVLGLALVNLVRPGEGLPPETREGLVKQYGEQASEKTKAPVAFGVETFVNIVPRNPFQSAVNMEMLQIIFVALLVGVGLTVIDRQRAEAVLTVLEGVGDLMVVIINMAMKIAPYGVFALVFSVTARFGFDLLRPLGLYVLVVIGGLALQLFGVLSLLVWGLARLSPVEFFRRTRDIMVTAFSTSSSNATLPTSIKVSEEELGVPPQIAGFVLPLGATMNMNGTALFEGVTVVFLAQVFGVELTLGQQLVVVVLSVLTAIGAAGVPGGSLPLLVMILAYAGVPEMGLALILGVDRLLDMCRTTLNVLGDVSAAAFIARSEGYKLKGS